MPLEAKEISFRYGKGHWVLEDISLHVEPGEVVGLTGSSGCGKTSLARVISGYQLPDKGQVLLDGKPLPNAGFSPVQLIFQHPEKAVNPRWRMRDILNEGWQPSAKQRAAFGIEDDWLSRWPHELSGGELQRFCVLRALGPHTRYLIADEMTTMLDAVTQAQIWHEVMAIAQKRNLGIIVVSHEESLVQRLCNRVINMEKHMDHCCSH